MTRRERGLNALEARIWSRIGKTVKPLEKPKRAPAPPADTRQQGPIASPVPPVHGRPRATPEDLHRLLSGTTVRETPEGGWRVATARASPPPGASPDDRGREKKVRRGRVDVSARLDLHGHTQETALPALAGFLAHHRSEGARSVLVITGKGRPTGEGVLRSRLPDWLARPEIRVHTSGYASAHARHGGEGAFYVFLKARPR